MWSRAHTCGAHPRLRAAARGPRAAGAGPLHAVIGLHVLGVGRRAADVAADSLPPPRGRRQPIHCEAIAQTRDGPSQAEQPPQS